MLFIEQSVAVIISVAFCSREGVEVLMMFESQKNVPCGCPFESMENEENGV